MKIIIRISLILLMPLFSFGQNTMYKTVSRNQADNILNELKITSNDTIRMMLSRDLANFYSELNFDSSIYYGEQVLQVSRKLNFKLWEANALYITALCFTRYGNYPKALEAYSMAKKLAEDEGSEKNIPHIEYFTSNNNPLHARLIVLTNILNDFGGLYAFTGNYEKNLSLKYKAIKIAESIDDKVTLSVVFANLGYDFFVNGKIDSAALFEYKAMQYANEAGFELYNGFYFVIMGHIWLQKSNYDSSEYYFKKGIHASFDQNVYTATAANYNGLTKLHAQKKQYDSSIFYAKETLRFAKSNILLGDLIGLYRALAFFYNIQNKPDSAYKYLSLSVPLNDSLTNGEKENLRKYQAMGFDEQLHLQELEKEKAATKNKVRIYSLLGGLCVLIIVGLILYRNNLHKQKANKVLEETLSNLKSTQSQLIQSEKMASLGELTAGIAHEIQNPLNFVNNFSEVNAELIDEMVDEVKKGNATEAEAIANDIRQNLEKITHHGKRADAIVKGMLQHSRSSNGQKEPTDINALADEYLRLAYHGLRAKDKSFNATLKTDFDETIGKINIIPQDIGRVILNLITNAFYVVNEKNLSAATALAAVKYEPTVSISTKKINNKIEIKVEDNGNGIPQKVLEKIFQPFFTTKPTGQGTGLGLSLSYDIVKAHAGELKVKTKEAEGTEFIIQLPLS